MSLVSCKKTTANPSVTKAELFSAKLDHKRKKMKINPQQDLGWKIILCHYKMKIKITIHLVVHKDDDDDDDDDDGKRKGQVKQKANPTAGILMGCPDLHLDQEDRRALIHRLSGKHIYAAQILLLK